MSKSQRQGSLVPALRIGMSLTILASAAAIAQSLQCPDIAKTLKEYAISTSSVDYLNSVFDNYCEQSGSAKSSSAGIGLDTVVKAIPIKFTGSYASNEEAMRNFCKSYSAVAAGSSRSFSYSERVSDKALQTINDCLRLQAQGITITHSVVTKETTAFFLKASGGQPIQLTGVVPSAGVACKGSIKGRLQTLDERTNESIRDTQNFVCTRLATQTSNPKVRAYPEASIIVSTSYGNYNVFLPRDERLADDLASEVSLRLDAVNSAVQGLQGPVASLTGARQLQLYQCPSINEGVLGGGAWGFYGCQGQISTSSTCMTIEMKPSNFKRVDNCAPIGSVKLF